MSHFTNSLLLAAALGMSASTLAENCTGDAAKLSAMDTVVMALNTQDLSLLDGIARSDFNRLTQRGHPAVGLRREELGVGCVAPKLPE